MQPTDIYGAGPYCWRQPPDGRLIACDRMKDHKGKHSWEDAMSGSVVTVVTASGEKRFAATAFEVDEAGYLSVRDQGREVARFAPSAWQGVHLPPREQDDRAVLEGRA